MRNASPALSLLTKSHNSNWIRALELCTSVRLSVALPEAPLPAIANETVSKVDQLHRQRLNHLQALEAESLYILREAVAEFARPVMLYSIGKDSSVMLRLAQKAFYPGRFRFRCCMWIPATSSAR